MNKKSFLIRNTALLAVSSFSTKLLQFFLIPFYTRVLNEYEYGVVDVLHSIATLIIPVVSLTIYEAVFRYAMDRNCNKKQVFASGLFISIFNAILLSIIAGIAYYFTKQEYIFIMLIYIITNIIRTIFLQFVRAIEKLRLYAIDNVINTIVTISLNILFLVRYHMGVQGYFIGYIVGYVISIIFLFISAKLYRYIKIGNVSKELLKKMLIFSLPLIPNTICWWAISFIDRIMITSMFGAAENGLYSVANKLPSIITILVGIFFDAWQISANKEFDNKTEGDFYSDVFERLISFVFLTVCFALPFSEIAIKIISGEAYWSSWIYVPILLLATALFSLAQFLGSIYTASKKTKMALITNVYAAIVNFILNFILLKYIGPIGAAISTAISYAVLLIYRIFDTRKIIKIKYNVKNMIITIICILVEILAISFKVKYRYIFIVLSTVIIVYLHFKFILEVLNWMKDLILKNIIKREKI